MIRKDGSYYQGNIVQGEPSGQGISYDATTDTTYRGSFQNGKPHGYGEEVSAASNFIGEFSFGYRSYGMYKWGKKK